MHFHKIMCNWLSVYSYELGSFKLSLILDRVIQQVILIMLGRQTCEHRICNSDYCWIADFALHCKLGNSDYCWRANFANRGKFGLLRTTNAIVMDLCCVRLALSNDKHWLGWEIIIIIIFYFLFIYLFIFFLGGGGLGLGGGGGYTPAVSTELRSGHGRPY